MKSRLLIMVSVSILFFIGLGIYYNESVVRYQTQLNLLIQYIYEETAPTKVVSVYQTFLNLESPYEDRLKVDLKKTLIGRYQYYATLYTLRKIEYEEYLKYEQIITELFPSDEQVVQMHEKVQRYYESQRAYVRGDNLREQGRIEDAISAYRDVLFNDEYYYELAQSKIQMCMINIREQYLKNAQQYFENEQYAKAIKQLNYLTTNGADETVESLKWHYQSEYYLYLMEEIDRLTEQERYGYLISYLE